MVAKQNFTIEKFYNALAPLPEIAYNHTDSCAYSEIVGINYLATSYIKYTGFKRKLQAVCLECGMPFIYDKFDNLKPQRFCSRACAIRYLGRQKKLKKINYVLKNTDFKRFKEWKNKYNNLVYSLILKYPSEYHNGMIDKWESDGFIYYAKIGKCINLPKVTATFFHTATHYWMLEVKRKLDKEVLIGDAPTQIQKMIEGEYND